MPKIGHFAFLKRFDIIFKMPYNFRRWKGFGGLSTKSPYLSENNKINESKSKRSKDNKKHIKRID